MVFSPTTTVTGIDFGKAFKVFTKSGVIFYVGIPDAKGVRTITRSPGDLKFTTAILKGSGRNVHATTRKQVTKLLHELPQVGERMILTPVDVPLPRAYLVFVTGAIESFEQVE